MCPVEPTARYGCSAPGAERKLIVGVRATSPVPRRTTTGDHLTRVKNLNVACDRRGQASKSTDLQLGLIAVLPTPHTGVLPECRRQAADNLPPLTAALASSVLAEPVEPAFFDRQPSGL